MRTNRETPFLHHSTSPLWRAVRLLSALAFAPIPGPSWIAIFENQQHVNALPDLDDPQRGVIDAAVPSQVTGFLADSLSESHAYTMSVAANRRR
jgi:hypothetical protein